ncbi:universal stress protein, partial [Streptomyces sp. JV181]
MNSEPTSSSRIVVGVDGSEPSKAALRWAVEQARVDGGAVDAVLAWESPTSW